MYFGFKIQNYTFRKQVNGIDVIMVEKQMVYGFLQGCKMTDFQIFLCVTNQCKTLLMMTSMQRA